MKVPAGRVFMKVPAGRVFMKVPAGRVFMKVQEADQVALETARCRCPLLRLATQWVPKWVYPVGTQVGIPSGYPSGYTQWVPKWVYPVIIAACNTRLMKTEYLMGDYSRLERHNDLVAAEESQGTDKAQVQSG
jgi:hypothetical protein